MTRWIKISSLLIIVVKTELFLTTVWVNEPYLSCIQSTYTTIAWVTEKLNQEEFSKYRVYHEKQEIWYSLIFGIFVAVIENKR